MEDNLLGGSEFAIASPEQSPDNVFTLNQQDREYYKSLFDSIDIDHDGYLSYEEMSQYVLQNGLPQDSFEKVFTMCDLDKDGFLDLSEFSSAAHLFHLVQTGVPLPPSLPSSLIDSLTMQETSQDDMFLDFGVSSPTQTDDPSLLQSSLNLDLIPTPKMDDFFAEEEDTNPFSKAAAQYIEDHQEEEEEKLRALKDAMNVPAVVCENRDKLLQVWVHNMKKWRESASRLDGKEKEIAEQKRSNSRLREEIKEAEEKLRSFQSDVEKRLNRISFLQAKLNNHLVQNELDRPVRASFAQPDLMDMFRAPESSSKTPFAKVSTKAALGSPMPVSYDVVENDPLLSPPSSSVNVFTSPMEEIPGAVVRERSLDPDAPPEIKFVAFKRSDKARSFMPQSPIAEEDSSDEDLKPSQQSEFNAFPRGKRSNDTNDMGSKRWYRSVYEKERLQKKEDEEHRKQVEREREEAKKREEEEERKKREEERKKREEMESISDYSSYSYSDYSDDDLPMEKNVFVMSDDEDDVFSDDDLPMEQPSESREVSPEIPVVSEVPPVGVPVEEASEEKGKEKTAEASGDVVVDEVPAEATAEVPADAAAEVPDETPADAAGDKVDNKKDKKDKKKDKKDKKNKKKGKGKETEAVVEPAKDDGTDEDLPMEKPTETEKPAEEPKKSTEVPIEIPSDDDLPAEKPAENPTEQPAEQPAEKPIKTPKKSPKTPKKTPKTPKEKKGTPKKTPKEDESSDDLPMEASEKTKDGQQKERRGRRGKKDKKDETGFLGELGKAKKHTKKKVTAKK